MIQKTLRITNYTLEKVAAVVSAVAAMPEYSSATQVLLIIMEQNWDTDLIRERNALICATLPKAEIVGTTHVDSQILGEKDKNCILSFLFFEHPAFTLGKIDMAGKDDEEFAEIKKHPGMGARILKNIEEMPKLATGAHWHHERYDGRGYPDGLESVAIPEEARIIAVADAYDAMTSNRSYRRGMDQDVVREQIENGKGTQFDPRFADIMIAMIDEDTEYRMREL